MSIIYTNDTPTYDFKCRLCHMILWETINYSMSVYITSVIIVLEHQVLLYC